MDIKHYIYFDSGTTNTRAYLLDSALNICHTEKIGVGSKDSAIAGNNRVIFDTVCSLYRSILSKCKLTDADIFEVYASGMVTSPYGLKEIPHLKVPITLKEFVSGIYPYYENSYMKRDILLIPGLKTDRSDFSFAGNMRGEEIEVIGALDELKSMDINSAALILPGSHTHITYVRDETIEDILSTFTGELFYAMQKDTILAPVLANRTEEPDSSMIEMAMDNLMRFGFNRAIYIGHAMRIMNKFSPSQRYAYCEGVINGGIRQSLEYYLKNVWTDCDAVVLICSEYMFRLLSAVFKSSEFEGKLRWLPLTPNSCYAIKGLKRLIKEKSKNK